MSWPLVFATRILASQIQGAALSTPHVLRTTQSITPKALSNFSSRDMDPSSFHTGMAYTLYLITYDRVTYLNTGTPKPYHWSFFIQKELRGTTNLGIEYQLRGMPGAFYYPGPEDVDLANSASVKEELQIGKVDAAKLDLVHQRLKECRIETVESSGWNCQHWTLEGLEMLRAERFVDATYTEEVVRNWLRES